MKLRPTVQNQEIGHVRAGGGAAPGANGGEGGAAGGEGAAPGGEGGAPNITGGGNQVAEAERSRINAIRYFAQANAVSDQVRDIWIQSGTSLEQVGKELIGIQAERNKNSKPASHLGMEPREVAQFSMGRAINAVASNNWTKAGLEANASRAIQERIGAQTDPNKFYVPLEVQQRAHQTPIEALAYQLMLNNSKRDLTAASAGAGGYLVETANVGFVELLRNRSVAFQMGASRMPGMVGNLTIPKQSAAGTAFWLANEATQITESQQTFVQIALSPKTVGGYTEISRQLLLQSSPAAEGLVMSDLAAIVAIAADLAILSGTGSGGQPTGITATAGIGAVTGTTLAYDDIIEFQTDTAAGNALFGSSGFVTTPAVAGLLKQRVKFSGTASPLWDGPLLDGNVDGYRGMSTNQLAAASMLFGYLAGVLVPEWGVLAIEVNPFANFQAGIVGVRAMYTMDVGVRYPTAFSLATSIT
jgi:HK97 family phage major capsid protein